MQKRNVDVVKLHINKLIKFRVMVKFFENDSLFRTTDCMISQSKPLVTQYVI
jgi:hypothetical protein